MSPAFNFHLQPNPRFFCIFCHTANHSSIECQKYASSNEFWQQLLTERRCKNCLRLYHRSDKCFDRSFCYHSTCRRQDKHSPILCHTHYRKIKYPVCGNNRIRMFPNIRSAAPPQFFVKRSYQWESRKIVSPKNYEKCRSSVYSQGCQTDNIPPVTVETTTSKAQEIPLKKISRGCQTDNRLENVSVQTAGFNVKFGYANCKKVPESSDSSFYVTKDFKKGQSQEAEVFQSVLHPKDTITDIKKFSLLLTKYKENDPEDPFSSLSGDVAKTKEQLIQGFKKLSEP